MRDFDAALLPRFISLASTHFSRLNKQTNLIKPDIFDQIIRICLPPVATAARRPSDSAEKSAVRVPAVGLHKSRRRPGIRIKYIHAVLDLAH